jgi:hypothetical protein
VQREASEVGRSGEEMTTNVIRELENVYNNVQIMAK